MQRFFTFLIAIGLAFTPVVSKAQIQESKMSQKDIKQLIDSISFSLKRYYIYPEKAAIIEKALRANLKNGVYKNFKEQQEIANTLNQDIRKAHYDGHMRLMYNPELEQAMLTPLPDSLLKKDMEEDLNEERLQNFYFVKTEVLPGNIGYVRWDGFVGFTQEAKPTYESAFRFVSNTKALILDMRYNDGGSPETVNALLNYFFESRMPMNHIIDHKHDTTKHYSDPSITSFKLMMPVYILTQKRTFSGAEDFTYAMKIAKRATIVGDTTGGGAHPTGPCTLGQGFVLQIPFARSWHEITKTDWEGTGVYPDVQVKGELALEKAQLLIFKDRLAKAVDDSEKQEAQGQITVVENKLTLLQNGSKNFSNEQLLKLCGDYKPIPGPGASPYILSIIQKGNNLYRTIPVPPDWKLIPISTTRFVYDHDDLNRYMEFTLDKDGKPSGITLYYVDKSYSYEKIR